MKGWSRWEVCIVTPEWKWTIRKQRADKNPPSKLSVSAFTRDALTLCGVACHVPKLFERCPTGPKGKKEEEEEKKRVLNFYEKNKEKHNFYKYSPHTRRQTKQLIRLSFKLGDAAAEWQPAWDRRHRTGNAALYELRGGGGGLWLWMPLHAPYCMY